MKRAYSNYLRVVLSTKIGRSLYLFRNYIVHSLDFGLFLAFAARLFLRARAAFAGCHK